MSSKNSQPWHYVVVRERATLQALGQMGTYAGHQEPLLRREAAHAGNSFGVGGTYHQAYTAVLLIELAGYGSGTI